MMKEILTISGKQGLYKLLSRGRGSLIVESIDESKKRFPIQGTDKVVSLGDISIFTDEGEMPLQKVFQKIEEKYGKNVVAFDYKKASDSQLLAFFQGIIPNFEGGRVYPSHVKKMLQWYNYLVDCGQNDFSEQTDETKQDEVVESDV